MRKRIRSLLIFIAMVIAILPLASTTANAEIADPFVTIRTAYTYSQSSDPNSITVSQMTPNSAWSGYSTSPSTKDFIATFLIFEVKLDIPAYSKVSWECHPTAAVGSLSTACSSYFGVELFHFDNYGEWEDLTLNTAENRTKSSSHSLGRDIDRTMQSLTEDCEASVVPSYYWKEYDNSNGPAKTVTFYYGVLAFYRSTSLLNHQLSVGWNFTDLTPYFDAKYIHYDANGGSGSADTVTGTMKEAVSLHSGEGFTKENSVFVGWNDGSTTYAPGGVYSKEKGAKLYAQYLTYDLSGCSGTVTPGVRDENGVTIASGDNIYKVGHTFQNWNTKRNGTGTAYAPGDIYSGSNGVTLYPIFELNKYDVTILSDNCTTTLNQAPATYGTKVEITAVPSVGYQLEGFEVYKTDDPAVKVPLTGNTFTQPEYPVTVKPILSKIPYAIEKYPTAYGSFAISHETAVIDDIVTITAIPEEGFELDTITVTRSDTGESLAVSGSSFTMVPAPIKVAVTFKNSIYAITKAPTANGSFTLDQESTILGDTVVVNAVPNEGYQVKSITAYKTGDESVTVEVTGGSFVMPAFPVTVAVEFEPASLEVFKSSAIENGDITISHTQAKLGDTVTVSSVAAKGYILDAITVYKTGDKTVTVEVTDGSFVMPGYPVTVHATFKKIDYTVSVVDASNEKGSFTVDKTTAQMGDTVTVDITCAEGWAIRGIVLTDSTGNTTFVDKVFTMPASNVTVSVSYMVIPTYVITIPATVELGGEPMTVSITNAVMEEGVSLKITLETDFTARTAEGAEKAFAINGGSVQNGDVILTVEGGGTPEAPKSGSAQLSLDWDDTYQYSGNYRATLAFTIRVEDEGYNQNE